MIYQSSVLLINIGYITIKIFCITKYEWLKKIKENMYLELKSV